MDKTLERIISLIPQNENGRFVRGAAAEFADKIGVAHNIPAEWKSGRNKSYSSKLYEISNAYDVSVDWLLGNTDEKKKPTNVSVDGLEDAKRRDALKLIVDNMSREEVDAFLTLFER